VIQLFYKIQNLLSRGGVKLDAKFSHILEIKFRRNILHDIDNSFYSDSAWRSSSDVECLDFFVCEYLTIMIDLFFQCSDIFIDQCIRKIYRQTIEATISAFTGTERNMDVEAKQEG